MKQVLLGFTLFSLALSGATSEPVDQAPAAKVEGTWRSDANNHWTRGDNRALGLAGAPARRR